MAKHVLLNNADHQNLKVKTGYSAEYGDSVASVLTFPSEFGDVHKEYPILFQKNSETGKYHSVVLLGFQKGENLFLAHRSEACPTGWNARYVPGMIAKGPFLIGFQNNADGTENKEAVVHIDVDSSKVGTEDGEPLFKDFGGITPYLERINTILQGLHAGISMGDTMFDAFDKLGLIEPVTINVELNNGEKISVNGNCTINKERLANLSGEELKALNSAGFLQGAFLILSSLGNVKRLIDIKNSVLK